MIIKIILTICSFSLSFFMMKRYHKIDRKFYQVRKNFIEYLDSINDIETLKHIGEINMFNQRERWFPHYDNMVEWLEKKIDETKDKHYADFLLYYEDFSKQFLFHMIIIFMGICVPIAYFIKFFQTL